MITALNGIVQDKIPENGKILHCAMEINGTTVYIADGSTQPAVAHLARSDKVPRLMCHMDLPDPYPLWEQLLQKGASSTITLEKQFWGDIYGAARDPMGVEWSLAKAPTPEDKPNYSGVTPYIRSIDCEKHIDWVQKVFAEEVKELFRSKEKKIMHCRMTLNGGSLYLCDRACAPGEELQEGDNSEGLNLHVVLSDPDMVWKKAMRNGAEVIEDIGQKFWGGYFGCFRDPMGVRWAMMKSGGQSM